MKHKSYGPYFGRILLEFKCWQYQNCIGLRIKEGNLTEIYMTKRCQRIHGFYFDMTILSDMTLV